MYVGLVPAGRTISGVNSEMAYGLYCRESEVYEIVYNGAGKMPDGGRPSNSGSQTFAIRFTTVDGVLKAHYLVDGTSFHQEDALDGHATTNFMLMVQHANTNAGKGLTEVMWSA